MDEKEKAMLEDFERQMREYVQRVLDAAPEHVRTLGLIIRKSITTGKLNALWRFCLKHAVDITKGHLPLFRDWLITQRIDLKDLEPEARERLRKHTLRFQDACKMTPDYRAGMLGGKSMHCRDCKYFVRAPNDGDPDLNNPPADKSCVALGTKGADVACYGHITCHAANITLFLGRKLTYDPVKNEFPGDDEANRLRSESLRDPWRV